MSCSCNDNDDDDDKNYYLFFARLIFSISIIVVFAAIEIDYWIEIILCGCAFLIAGYEIIWNAFKSLLNGKIFDENTLMLIASASAFAIGDHVEAIAVIAFFSIGEWLQDLSADHSKKNIMKLLDIRPDYVNKITNNNIIKVDPKEVKIGDIILVKPGEKIGLDGIITKGNSFLDMKSLTGESVPQAVKSCDNVLSGSINIEGVLEIKVLKEFSNSTISKILDLIENSENKKSQSEKFITKFAKIYTPIVVTIAILVAILPPLLSFGSWDQWIYRAITFLIVSCPCALVISIPIGILSGIGGCAKNGILIKGGNYLEALNEAKTIIFDKTGTLTQGVFEIVDVNSNKITKNKLIELVAIAEQHSNHPIANSILQYYNKPIKVKAKIKEIAGNGIIAKFNNKVVHVGNIKLLQSLGIKNLPQFVETTIYVACNKKYLGYITIADKLKDNIANKINELKNIGIKQQIMLTGDNEGIAQNIAKKINISAYYANLLPQDKVEEFKKIKKNTNDKIMFVGDGINDAPVLNIADIGIAVGDVGSDIAIESADIVLMNGDIGKILIAKKIAKKTHYVIIQNIVFALLIKIIAMVLGFLGITFIWIALVADLGVALLCIANSIRCFKVSHKKKDIILNNGYKVIS